MDPKARKSIRLTGWINAARSTVGKTLQSLFNLDEGDGLRSGVGKILGLFVRLGIYFLADNGLNALQFAIAVGMKMLEFSLLQMFGVLWIFDFIAAGIFVVIHETTGKDLTVSVDTRRAADSLREKSKLLGALVGVANILLAVAWTGPEKVLAYYRKEIGSNHRLLLALVILTGIQSFLWTLLYYYAYDIVVNYL